MLRFYRDWIADCPDELMTIVVQRRAPALPIVPAEMVGKHVIAVTACYAGPVEDGARVMRPLKSFGQPLLDLCGPKPYWFISRCSMPARGWRYYVRSCDVAELNDDVIDIVAEHGRRIVSPITSVGLWQMGGAVARIGRTKPPSTDAAPAHVQHQRQQRDGGRLRRRTRLGACVLVGAIAYHTSTYVNFLMDEGAGRIRQAYGAAKYERLKTLKRTYDPENFFRLNQNIPPD